MNIKLKRITTIFISIMTVFTLAACNANEGNKEKKKEKEMKEEKKKEENKKENEQSYKEIMDIIEGIKL